MKLQKTALEFDEEKHVYRLDGIVLPSVTHIMEPLSQKKYDGIPRDVLMKAANRGSVIHEAIENIIKYDFDDYPEEYEGYVSGFLEFRDKYHPEVVGSEYRLYHKYLAYAGTADLLCMIDGKLNLIDYKSTSVINPDLCRVQLEAYSQALESHGIKVEQRRILHLKATGQWEDVLFTSPDDEAWRVFLALKTIEAYMNH